MKHPLGIFLLFASFLCSCSKSNPNTLFELMDNNAIGINFENKIENREDFNILNYRNFYNGGGVAVGDINNDGLPDVCMTGNMGGNKLFLNKSDSSGFHFEDITARTGIAELDKWNTGVVMVDINNDSLLDIYVCNAGYRKFTKNQKNALFINKGNLTFVESAAKYGLDEGGYTTHTAFFDYDLDGDLDCYILNNSFIPVNTLNYANNRDVRAEDWSVKDYLKGGGDKLMRNDNGHFSDVSKEAGVYSSLIGFGLGVTIGDANNDNFPDIYISNDFYEKDYLYINQRDGTFREEIEQRMKHISLASMGADMADINNDGFPEIVTTDMLPRDEYRLKTTASFDNNYVFRLKKDRGFYNQFQQNSLQLNNQDGTFSEIGHYANVSASDWSWGALLFDADNDGYNDMYVCNGIFQDVIDQDFIDFFADELIQEMENTGTKQPIQKIIAKIPSNPIPNNFFHNTKNLKFKEEGESFGLSKPSFSNGAAYADLDNDGDLDLLVNNVNMPCFVYRNRSEKQSRPNHYIKLKLKGEKQNTFAIGAKAEIFVNNTVLSRSIAPSRGFQSSTEYALTIGLGENTTIDSIKITWPDLRTTTLLSPKVNQTITLSIRDALSTKNKYNIPIKSIFEEKHIAFDKHQENDYEDFYKEKNIPMCLSAEGPRIAIGDINGDGKDDLYIGGAKTQPGQLYIQTAMGFKKSPQQSFENFADFEDTAVAFFDADNDNDLDLFVGSGGNEASAGDRDMLNRLYLNDGKGTFNSNVRALPSNSMNTATVAPYDYDNDGDIDLFVGSRSVPMQYGVTPPSFLYENNGKGEFKDITKAVAPELLSVGMVRDAQWQDIDGDKQKELLIVGDWFAPTIFKIKNKKIVKVDAGLNSYAGFWGALKITDIDNDGDNDLVLGNIGENFAINISPETPLKIAIGDFDNNESIDKILVKTIEKQEVTVFLKRETAEQFPLLKKLILKHADFATKNIKELFPMTTPDNFKVVNYAKSAVALNDGKGHFSLVELPAIAQLSCINAIECMDINNDGLKDLIIGGNFTHFIPQLTMLDASRGNVLLNKGKGNFVALNQQISGFVTNGEIRQINTINIQGKTHFIALINNEIPKVFRLN